MFDGQSFAFDKGPGRFFLAPDDDVRGLAHTVPPTSDGSYVAVVHGAPDFVQVGSTVLSPRDLADLIRSDGNYQPGQPVRLLSCSTGAWPGGFAQQLANELGAPVTAPTSLAWLPPEKDGSILVTPANPFTDRPLRWFGQGLGEWKEFQPQI